MPAKPSGRACAMCKTTEPWRSRSPVCQECRDALEREGTCIRCRQNPAIQDHPKRICEDCKGERSASKRRREARRAARLCATCDTPSGAYRCETCIEGPRRAMAKFREAKIAEGLCGACFKNPVSPGEVCAACRDWLREHFTSMRQTILAAYGAACACCGLQDQEVLDIDHLEPGWHGQGGRPSSESGGMLHSRIIAAGFPDQYQVLCRNCNWSRRLHGVCRLSHTEEPACFLRSQKSHSSRRIAQVRREVLAAYGGCCTDCGLEDLDVLDVDHVGGGGRAERRGFSHHQLWLRLRREGFPQGYRVLCRNCNWKDWRARARTAVADGHEVAPPASRVA